MYHFLIFTIIILSFGVIISTIFILGNFLQKRRIPDLTGVAKEFVDSINHSDIVTWEKIDGKYISPINPKISIFNRSPDFSLAHLLNKREWNVVQDLIDENFKKSDREEKERMRQEILDSRIIN